MNIVYAAEKPSIAGILSERLRSSIGAEDIEVHDDPNQTGSFLVHWGLERFRLLPDGRLARCQCGPQGA